MPTHDENAIIQACETIGGTISIITILMVGRKLRKDQALDSTSRMLIRSLCLFNLILSVFFAIGRAAKGNHGFCQFQGLMIQWFSTAIMFWVVLQSYVMYQWIVLKKHFKRMERLVRRGIVSIIVGSGILAFILLGTNSFGSVYLWCWIEEDNIAARVLCFDVFLVGSWVISIVILHSISQSITERIQSSSIHQSISTMLGDSKFSVEKKLTVYIGAFIFVWFFALLNRTVENALDKPFFPTALLQAIFLPLQGLINGLLYGNAIDIKKLLHWEDLRKVFLGIHAIPRSELNESVVAHRPASSGKAQPVVPQPPITYTPRQYSIFITSLNMGEAPLDSFYGDVKDWIVEGHDVYAIGLQECIDLAGLRELILNHLGGPSKYCMYTTSIGSGNTSLGYHGFIALTLYVRASEVIAGNICATKPAVESAATGADLIVTTAQNKGAVGIALHMHDTSIGFVTCHLPSDSKGKSKLTKRNASAHAILKQVILAPEDLGFDLHLQHDHVFVFGDLNYRMDTTGTGGGVNSLTGVAVACTIEKQTLNDDPNWLARKYNLLRHHSDVLYPSREEVKLIKAAMNGSRGAWSSVLRADELRSIMDDGDAFCGFEEPMPCFPPSYKRKKGKLEGHCGDYTDFSAIIRGYSNTGDVENMLVTSNSRPKSSAMAAGFSGSVERVQQFVNHAVRPNSSKLSAEEIRHLESQLNKSSSGGDLSSKARSSAGGEEGGSGADSTVSDERDGGPRDSEDTTNPSVIGEENEREGRTKRRKAAVVVPGNVETVTKKETDPSKLRPPSYTDRILLHSLPDRQDRLTVQAYDFCDVVRCSDHRPVSMTALVEVNAAVNYRTSSATSLSTAVSSRKTMDFQYSPMAAERNTIIPQEPVFELYEVIITDMAITLYDLEDVEEEDEDDEDVVYRDSMDVGFSSSENPMRRDSSSSWKRASSGRVTSSLRSAEPEVEPMPTTEQPEAAPTTVKSPTISPKTSPNQSPSPPRGALKKSLPTRSETTTSAGVRFGDATSEGQMIEMSSTDSSASIRLPEVIVPDVTNSHAVLPGSAGAEEASGTASAPSPPPPRPGLAKSKSSRRRSIFTSFFFSSSTTEEDSEASDMEKGKATAPLPAAKGEEEELSEEDLIKALSRENMNWWKNKLHKPNEWRKRKLEEQRRLKEMNQTSASNKALSHLAGEVKKVHKKAKKSDDKNIDHVTIVFPLPSKDPLLAHRKVYDYAQVFELGDGIVHRQGSTPTTSAELMDGRTPLDDETKITKDDLLRPFTTFKWATSSHSTLNVLSDPTMNPLLSSNKSTSRSSLQLTNHTQTVIATNDHYKVKGCASIELGAHVLLKIANKAGYEFGSAVICLSQLLHTDPQTMYSSRITEIPLTAGGQKRGHMSGKFSIRFIPSALSINNTQRRSQQLPRPLNP